MKLLYLCINITCALVYGFRVLLEVSQIRSAPEC